MFVFNIDIALFDFIIYHNTTINAITKRIPNEIKDTDDLGEIGEVNNNIIKSMSRKLKFKANIFEHNYLLLCNNIKVKKNLISELYHKKKYIIYHVYLLHMKIII